MTHHFSQTAGLTIIIINHGFTFKHLSSFCFLLSALLSLSLCIIYLRYCSEDKADFIWHASGECGSPPNNKHCLKKKDNNYTDSVFPCGTMRMTFSHLTFDHCTHALQTQYTTCNYNIIQQLSNI